MFQHALNKQRGLVEDVLHLRYCDTTSTEQKQQKNAEDPADVVYDFLFDYKFPVISINDQSDI